MAYLKFINMKNLFFALALMLVGTFAFANTSKTASELDLDGGVTVNTSCGEVGTIIVRPGDTVIDILEMAQEMEEWLCGDD